MVAMDLLRHLDYFLAVADAGSFSKAAQDLGMAQPPLSQRIRALERHLDVELFDRSRRQIQLTPAGQLLTSEARTMLQLSSDLHAVLHSVGAQPDTVFLLPATLPTRTLVAIARESSAVLDATVRPEVSPPESRSEGHAPYRLAPGPAESGAGVQLPLGLALDAAHPVLRAGNQPHPSDFADGTLLILDEDGWQDAHIASTLVSYGVPTRRIRAGIDPATAPAVMALHDAACLTDPVHAAAHHLSWFPATPGLTRSWRVVGRRAGEVASAVQRVLDGGSGHG